VADIEWKPLPTPMWSAGSVMADWSGMILEASFEQASISRIGEGRFMEHGRLFTRGMLW
jgi:hypothetical protein